MNLPKCECHDCNQQRSLGRLDSYMGLKVISPYSRAERLKSAMLDFAEEHRLTCGGPACPVQLSVLHNAGLRVGLMFTAEEAKRLM